MQYGDIGFVLQAPAGDLQAAVEIVHRRIVVIEKGEDFLLMGFIALDINAGHEAQVGALEFIFVFLRPDSGTENHQAGDGADDDGVDKGFENRHHALVGGFLGSGRSVGDGRTALPRFVRIQAAIDAAVEGIGKGGAKKSAGGGGAGQGVGKNRRERRNDIAEVRNDDRYRADEVEHRHRRHHGGGEFRDAGNTADDHEGEQRRHENGGDQRVE